MLEVAFLSAHMLWMTGREDIERLYDMVTVAAAKAMNVSGFGAEHPGGLLIDDQLELGRLVSRVGAAQNAIDIACHQPGIGLCRAF